MSANILAVFKAEYEYMSRVERKIAERILTDPNRFIGCSLAEFSAATEVSQGSIVNFSKKYSTGGFSALKAAVADCLKSEADTPFAVVDKSQGVKAAMEIKIRENMIAFQNTLALNDEKTLNRVVDKILSAKKIEIYGIFNSGIVATSFCYQLIQLGIPATFVSDTLMCAISASMLDKDSLVIAISASGRTKEILDAVKMARNNGVSVICLTANGNSPLTQVSDEVLLCASSGMTVSDRSEEIRLSQYLIVDTLCAYLRSITDQSGQTHYFKLREILNSHNVND